MIFLEKLKKKKKKKKKKDFRYFEHTCHFVNCVILIRTL